jgi:hypothetical protein
MHDIRPFIIEPFKNPGSLLYVGARADAHSWLPELLDAGNLVTILEIWEPNVIGLMDSPIYSRLHRLIQGNIQDFERHEFDYIWWWHGPEHISQEQIPSTLLKLEDMAYKMIVLACPFGVYNQGTYKGNPFEEHKCHLTPDFFINLGCSVETDGIQDSPGSEIVAWKSLLPQSILD